MFEFFDPSQDFVIRHGNLPHWFQPGVTYFVTFRTDDSIPQPLLRAWYRRRDAWLRDHGIEPANPQWRGHLAEIPELEAEFHARFTSRFMTYLDRGYGACLLRDQKAAQLVQNALLHFDGVDYHMGDFIVMPNHVHLLVYLLGDTEIEAQCRSWKRFSANRINRLRDRRGRFWQAESFDHLVRNAEQFERFEKYIAENPRKALLAGGDFLYRRRPR
jgi:REP-associated tyrosine transposase